jgi:hypothetical protein
MLLSPQSIVTIAVAVVATPVATPVADKLQSTLDFDDDVDDESTSPLRRLVKTQAKDILTQKQHRAIESSRAQLEGVLTQSKNHQAIVSLLSGSALGKPAYVESLIKDTANQVVSLLFLRLSLDKTIFFFR